MVTETKTDILPWGDNGAIDETVGFHKLTFVNKECRTAVCSICGPCKIRLKQDKPVCWTRVKESNRRRNAKKWTERREAKKAWKLENALPSGNDYRRFAKPVCEKCGFQSADPCQIDVHHKDRNRKNGHISNLISLCANCHRLEHKDEKFIHPGRPKKESTGLNGRKPVLLRKIDLSEERSFHSRLEAAKFLDVNKSDVYSLLKGNRKSIKGWVLPKSS